MWTFLKSWLALKSDERAVTMLEYGLIAALISVVALAAITGIGTGLTSKFATVSSAVN